jgi:hypothetical protein
VSEPIVLEDVYEIALLAAYDAARNDKIRFSGVMEYLDAAEFIGARLGKSGEDVINELLDCTIAELERGDMHE